MKGRKVVSVLLVAAMTTGLLAACGAGNGSTEGKDEDLITLTVFSQLANYSGEQIGWSADVLAEKFGVKLNIVNDTNGTLQTRMESGDLGDIVVFGSNGTDYMNAINSGLLYDWNEDDLLTEYGPYIKENLQDALDYNASYSNGTTYGFGHGVATTSTDLQDFFYTWDIRWDLYEQLGRPEVKNWDDLVELFKQMKEICPTDDNGNATYAASLWPDWDGGMAMYVKSTATAYYGYDEMGIGLYDPQTGTFYDCLAEDGPYLQALKFYNKLYQEKLLDPDSMGTTYDAMIAKVQSGGTFFSIFNYAGSTAYNTEEHVSAGKMMCSLVPSEASPIDYGMSTLGSNRVWCIGAKSEYPELCMEVINYLTTPEGRLTMEYGPQGVTWDYDEEGNTYLTDLGKLTVTDGTTSMADAGYKGTFADGQLQINNITWAIDASNPDSNGETYNYKNWKSQQQAASSEVEQQWRDYTGCNTINEYMASGNYVVSPSSTYVESTKEAEFQTKWDQTTGCIVTGSWNAIYAESDAEFDQIVAQMREEANSYYYEACVEWCQNEAALRYAAEQELSK